MNRMHEALLVYLKERYGDIHYEVLGDLTNEDINTERYDKAIKLRMLVSAPRLKFEGPISDWTDQRLELFFLDLTGRHYSSPITIRSQSVNNAWPIEPDICFDQSICFKVWDFDNKYGYFLDFTWAHLNDSAIQKLQQKANEQYKEVNKIRSEIGVKELPNPKVNTFYITNIEFSKALELGHLEELDCLNFRDPNEKKEEPLSPYQALMREPPCAYKVSSQLPKEHNEPPDYPYLRYHEEHRITARHEILNHDWRFQKNFFYKPTKKGEWENALIDSLNLYHRRIKIGNSEMPETSWNWLKNRYFDPMGDSLKLFVNPKQGHSYDETQMNIFSSRYESVERNIYLHVSAEKIIEFKRIDPNSIYPRFYSPNEKSELFIEIEKILSTSPGDSKFRNDRYDLIKPHETFFDYLKKLFFTSEADMVEKIIDDDRSNW